jgi:hypothetical protein
MRLFFLPQAEANNRQAAIITAAGLFHSHVRDMHTSSSCITTMDTRKCAVHNDASTLKLATAIFTLRKACLRPRFGLRAAKTNCGRYVLLAMNQRLPLLKNSHTNFFLDF